MSELEKKYEELILNLKIGFDKFLTGQLACEQIIKLESEIATLKQQGVEEIYYECTKCKYRMTKIEYFSVKEDFGCPSCQTTFHKFKRIIKGDPVSAEEFWKEKEKGWIDKLGFKTMVEEKVYFPKEAWKLMEEYAQQGDPVVSQVYIDYDGLVNNLNRYLKKHKTIDKVFLIELLSGYMEPLSTSINASQQGEVTDEIIEAWAKKYISETEHYFHSTKDLIIGAKAVRDNLIK